ncbi:MAG: T9SS type A sorting domain-containing protein [Bacteroidota bacterium]
MPLAITLRLSLISICILTIINGIAAQHFLGGQTWMRRTGSVDPPGEVSVYLEVFRTIGSTARENILLDWGDGQADSLELIFTGIYPDQGILADYYQGTHTYDTFGYMVYEYRDSFLVDDVLNIPNSGQQPLILSDTVLVFDLDGAPFINPATASIEGMFPATSLESFTLQPDGEIIKALDYWRITDPTLPPYTVDFQVYPLTGATLPAATDRIGVLDNRNFSWLRPPAASRYALSFHTRQLFNTNNPYYDNVVDANRQLLINTLTRSVILDITEDMIVDVPSIAEEMDQAIVFPNPTSAKVQIATSSPITSNVSIFDATGRYLTKLVLSPVSGQMNTYGINLSTYPAGAYFLSWQSSSRVITKKIILTR